jgi:molybdenum cofactor cytidylyltransferase
MKFGPVATLSAEGAVLAHAIRHGDRSFRKGHVLTAADVAALSGDGIDTVVVARLEADDVPENEAAAALAEALCGDGVRVATAFTGRANLHATVAGVFCVKAHAIDAINAIDEALTIATLPAFEAAGDGAMLATVKIIPYAVKRASLNAALSLAKALGPVVEVAPYRPAKIALISTALPGTKPAIHAKNRATLEGRLAGARAAVVSDRVVAHQGAALAEALRAALGERPDLVLIYAATAIADRHDVAPAGLVAAGGEVLRFGMPVDPGNLLLLGRHGDVPVVGLPGCARSPRINGFDWVLQRLLAGVAVTPDDIARMGVGGLLKEIPTRPQPRERPVPVARQAGTIGAVVLAAGRSSRMGAAKQLALIDGEPMLRRTVEAVIASGLSPVVVVTGHEAEHVGAALKGLSVTLVRNPDYALGLSTSLKAGLEALPADIDGALIALGDMPRVTAEDIAALASAFDPAEGRGIVVPVHEGKRGNPVLWAEAFFPEMKALSGDTGAKAVIAANPEAVFEVERGPGVLMDVDTPADLEALNRGGAA